MELYANLAEYFDELFPVTETLKEFYQNESEEFSKPVHYLSLCCGTGTLEHYLSKNGSDVTGTEKIPSLLESANRKRRTQLMALRYFDMDNLEINHFLGKNFYNIVSILNNRIIHTKDKILLQKLFHDCFELLKSNGKLIFTFPYFQKYNEKNFSLPEKESIRVKLISKIRTNENNVKILEQKLKTGNGSIIPVTVDAPVLELSMEEIKKFASEAGYSKCEFFGDFSKSPVSNETENIIAIIRK